MNEKVLDTSKILSLDRSNKNQCVVNSLGDYSFDIEDNSPSDLLIDDNACIKSFDYDDVTSEDLLVAAKKRKATKPSLRKGVAKVRRKISKKSKQRNRK